MPRSSNNGEKLVDSRNIHNLVMGSRCGPSYCLEDESVQKKGADSFKVSNVPWAQINQIIFAHIFPFHLILCDFDMEEILFLL